MNRFEINVAVNGRHYCRIALPETIEADAVRKAKQISKTMLASPDMPAGDIAFSLTCWNDMGHTITIG